MSNGYLPAGNADLLAWATNFAQLISNTPTAYGLTADQASAFSGLQVQFAQRYAEAFDPSTRTPVAIEARNTARNDLVASARELVRIVQAYPALTDTQRTALKITVRKHPSPVPAPTQSPNIDVMSVEGRTVKIKLHDGSGTRRGRPAGVAGATLFTFVGAVRPDDVADWKFEGNINKTVVELPFDTALPPGTTVWITAFWRNAVGNAGPATVPISLTFGAAGVSQPAPLKMAA